MKAWRGVVGGCVLTFLGSTASAWAMPAQAATAGMPAWAVLAERAVGDAVEALRATTVTSATLSAEARALAAAKVAEQARAQAAAQAKTAAATAAAASAKTKVAKADKRAAKPSASAKGVKQPVTANPLDLSLPAEMVSGLKPRVDKPRKTAKRKPLLPAMFPDEAAPDDSPFQLNGRLISNEMQLQMRNDSRRDVEGAAIDFQFRN